MPQESEISKKLTRAIKASDKLVQDIKKDVGHLIACGKAVKEVFEDLRKPGGPDDKT
jgi:hypothetical protein